MSTSNSSIRILAGLALLLGATACHRATQAERDAQPIVERNAAARGGATAWRAVGSLTMAGSLEAGRPRDQLKLASAYLRQRYESKAEVRRTAARRATTPEPPVQLPFVMEAKRPHKTRVEVRFKDQTAVQVFDGTSGWKLRPFLGRHDVEPFSAEETRLALQQSELEGPLLEAVARGDRVELEGTEPVDGNDAYRLRVTARDGQVRHVWVDVKTALDVKVDGSRRLDGKPHAVWTTFRDFRQVNGLLVPFQMETTVEGVPGAERITAERVTLDAPLADARFARPE